MNTIAGGGSFLTFPALLMTGLDPRAANITSTIALFPMQVGTGFAGRKHAGGTDALPFKALFVISLIGGIIGAGLLLLTPSGILRQNGAVAGDVRDGHVRLGEFFKRPDQMSRVPHLGRYPAAFIQFLIAIYGGYFRRRHRLS